MSDQIKNRGHAIQIQVADPAWKRLRTGTLNLKQRGKYDKGNRGAANRIPPTLAD